MWKSSTEIVSISRKSTGITHPKLVEVIRDNFLDYNDIGDHFKSVDTAYYCLGVYTGAVPDATFKKITLDYTNAFADVLKDYSPKATFCLLSGAGADQTEKSSTSFARYKGMSENYLIKKEFENLFIFRPAYIYPVEKRKSPNIMYTVSRLLYPVIRILGDKVSIKSTELAEAIFNAGMNSPKKMILENQDILASLK